MPTLQTIRFTRHELQAIDDAIEHLSKVFVSKINAQDLSDTYNIPVKKLQAGIIKRTGLTIHAYIEAARLRKAKELIADETPLKCIAELIGYKTASQFGYFFKKHTGQTPLEYRNQIAEATERPLDLPKPILDKSNLNLNKS
jgi:AraC family transcriptional regulator, melibiose operon regulatory protein